MFNCTTCLLCQSLMQDLNDVDSFKLCMLQEGYAVIFLNRKHSIQPFTKGLPSGHIMECLTQVTFCCLCHTGRASHHSKHVCGLLHIVWTESLSPAACIDDPLKTLPLPRRCWTHLKSAPAVHCRMAPARMQQPATATAAEAVEMGPQRGAGRATGTTADAPS